MNDLLRRIAALSHRKRALLLRRLDGLEWAPVASVPLERQAEAESYPLSSAQERLWFVHQMDPGSVAYNVPAAVRIGGRLDTEVLAAALSDLARRHEALRTSFAIVGGAPAQRVAPAVDLPLRVVDLRTHPEQTREAEARRVVDAQAGEPFELGEAPLLRACLVRMGEEESVLAITMHHIVTDGASSDLIFRELGVLYEARASGREPRLEHLPVRYVDYAVWQRRRLGENGAGAQLAYWTERLRGLEPLLDLPLDRPRPEVLTDEGGSHAFLIPAAVMRPLEELGRREGATLFMTLLAAFQALLRWYARTDDVAVGSPVTMRDRAELQGVVGFFVNTLVLRSGLSGDPSFADLVRRVRDTCLEAYATADVPFERIVEELRPDRVMNRNPLFEVTFTFEDVPPSTQHVPGLSFEPFEVEAGTGRGTLWLSVATTEQGAEGVLTYSRDLFLAATVAGMAEQLLALLAEAAARPEARLSELDRALDAALAARRSTRETEFRQSRREGLRTAARRTVPAPGS